MLIEEFERMWKEMSMA